MVHQTINIAYHYTSIDTFLKMLDDVKYNNFLFWGSYILSMNDPSEFAYGLNMVHQLLTPIENELLVHKDDRLSRIWDENELKEKHIAMLSDTFSLPFVICFSNRRDFLPQWITYGDNGMGVSLGFRIQDYCRIIKTGKNNYIDLTGYDNNRLYALRISYKKISHKHAFKNSLRGLYEEYINKIRDINDIETKCSIQLDYLHSIAFYLSALIKHEAYSYEDETRILFPRSKIDNVRFRTNAKGQIIPYIKIGIETNRLKKVIIGPLCDFEPTKLMINTRLRQLGINDVKIIKSQIPFR